MPIGRGRSGGGVRSVSGFRGEGGGVFPRGAGSGALILALEAAGCGRRAKACLGRFILRHSVAAASSALSFSACLPRRRASNCWIVSSLQKYRIRIEGRAIWRLPGSSSRAAGSGKGRNNLRAFRRLRTSQIQ